MQVGVARGVVNEAATLPRSTEGMGVPMESHRHGSPEAWRYASVERGTEWDDLVDVKKLHHYIITITSLLHHYYYIITITSLLHHYYYIITITSLLCGLNMGI